MTRVAATLPGYASVGRASEVLHLAQRSVRDLIYAGRLPSLRIGRQHYIKSTDLEQERRRRLGLPAQRHAVAGSTHRRRRPIAAGSPVPSKPRQPSLDDAMRRQRAAERAALADRWAQRHGVLEPRVPARILTVVTPVACDACGREVRHGRVVRMYTESPDTGEPAGTLCVSCGRRALLDWADQRRLEAAAARRFSVTLGEPERETPAELPLWPSNVDPTLTLPDASPPAVSDQPLAPPTDSPRAA